MTTGKNTKAYETPNHPYQGARIAEESDMLGRYGLKNKEELWRNESELRDMRREARRLLGDAQGDVDLAGQKGAEFVARLRKLGLLSDTDNISAVLSLDVTDLLERRLQTVAYRQGMASSVKQARQFITHGHITVSGARVTRPSKKVTASEEDEIGFDETSPLADDLHPERAEVQE